MSCKVLATSIAFSVLQEVIRHRAYWTLDDESLQEWPPVDLGRSGQNLLQIWDIEAVEKPVIPLIWRVECPWLRK